MKRQLQGIALILLGILLVLLDAAGGLWIPNIGTFDIGWGLSGLILGIAGVIVAFLPNRHE